jgi:hypothetical protein
VGSKPTIGGWAIKVSISTVYLIKSRLVFVGKFLISLKIWDPTCVSRLSPSLLTLHHRPPLPSTLHPPSSPINAEAGQTTRQSTRLARRSCSRPPLGILSIVQSDLVSPSLLSSLISVLARSSVVDPICQFITTYRRIDLVPSVHLCNSEHLLALSGVQASTDTKALLHIPGL